MSGTAKTTDWLANPRTPLERYLAACHRYYLACRDGAAGAKRGALLRAARRLERQVNG